MTDRILNIDDLEYRPWSHGDRFEAKMGEIGLRLGSEKLGYNLTVVAPGKSAFPFHSHRVNEEMFFVLEGQGEVRIGDERHPVRRGDVIACPPGGPDSAHQMVNTSDSEELKYLAVSTMQTPEIAEYPDSGKYGVLARFRSADGDEPEVLRLLLRQRDEMPDYWEGE